MASRLFALDGAEVAEVDEEPGGGRTVWVVTADPGARVCPVCKTPLEHVREQRQPLIIEEPPDPGQAGGQPGPGRSPELTAAQLRRLMISEFRDWLGSRTNRNGRPFQADTVSAYADAAIALDAWMTAEGIDADFTACDTAMLNRFFAAYFRAHGRAGPTPSSGTCGTCSAGSSVSMITRTPTPTTCSVTPRRRPGHRRWPGSSSPTCWK